MAVWTGLAEAVGGCSKAIPNGPSDYTLSIQVLEVIVAAKQESMSSVVCGPLHPLY